MPVQKFRSLDEARQALWMDRDDPRLAQTIRSLWAFSRRLTGELPVPRGVNRFHDIEEANSDREQWEKLRVEVLGQRRACQSAPPLALAPD